MARCDTTSAYIWTTSYWVDDRGKHGDQRSYATMTVRDPRRYNQSPLTLKKLAIESRSNLSVGGTQLHYTTDVRNPRVIGHITSDDDE